jgi:Flp pilus assembly protein TadD
MIDQLHTRFPTAFWALALLVIALLLILHPPRSRYLELLYQGEKYAEKTERTAAVIAYQEAARRRPDEPLPRLRLAQVYLEWGRYGEALDALTLAERLGAEETSVQRLRIALHTARTDWPAVIESAQEALTLVPDDQEAYHALARARLELREWEKARSVYRALLRDDPADTAAQEHLGILLLGNDPEAIQHLLAAQTELADQLIALFTEAQTVGDRAYTAAVLGRALIEAGESALAARQFEQALDHNADYAEAHAYLGHALYRMGHLDESGYHLQRAVTLAPDSAVAHTFLGLHHERLGDLAAARAEYEKAYDLDPQNPAICVEIGQSWAVEGRYTTAEIWLREAVSLKPNDPTFWEVLARFYLDHNITAEGRAIDVTTKLVELAPDSASAHDLRGWAAFQSGNYETAQKHLRLAIALNPSLASAHYHRGLLYRLRSETKKAHLAFIRALDLDTTGELAPLIKRALGEDYPEIEMPSSF